LERTVAQAALDVAGKRAGDKAQGQPPEEAEQLAAQVAHDVLPDPLGEVALPDPEQRHEDRDGDHRPVQDQHEAEVRSAAGEQPRSNTTRMSSGLTTPSPDDSRIRTPTP